MRVKDLKGIINQTVSYNIGSFYEDRRDRNTSFSYFCLLQAAVNGWIITGTGGIHRYKNRRGSWRLNVRHPSLKSFAY